MTNHDDNWGILQSQQDEDHARASAVADPAGYHANIAARELHWFNASASQWLSRCDGTWRGWHSQSGEQFLRSQGVERERRKELRGPWRQLSCNTSCMVLTITVPRRENENRASFRQSDDKMNTLYLHCSWYPVRTLLPGTSAKT